MYLPAFVLAALGGFGEADFQAAAFQEVDEREAPVSLVPS